MGGYSSFPVCIAAKILRIPFIIYENNLYIGKANRFLLPYAKKVFVSYKELGGGVILTLIHEIDYLYWLFGEINSVYAIGKKKTNLKINVEDSALISMITKSKIPIHLRMDYWSTLNIRNLKFGKKKVFRKYYYRAIMPKLRTGVYHNQRI